MTLRLVASGNDEALEIRDHVLKLLRRDGVLEVQRDTVRLVELRVEPWIFRSWTPFSALQPGEASSPGYRHAIERQHTRPDLPYGLEVRHHGTQVLRVLWADTRAFEIDGFVRGPWETAALAL
jgi:hypothetical protein